MKESRPQRFSYNYAQSSHTLSNKSYRPLSISQNKQQQIPTIPPLAPPHLSHPHPAPPAFHIEPMNQMKDQLRRGYETIENLKAEVELEKQGRQFAEEQGKYLSKKVESLNWNIEKLENDVIKYKEKYRKLKSKRERSIGDLEPFEDSNFRSREAELFLKEQETLKVKIKALETRVNTPSKAGVDSVPRSNYQQLLSNNNRLNQRNAELEKMLKFMESKLKSKQIELGELGREINIYHSTNFKAEQGFEILERQMQLLIRENQSLKEIIVNKQQTHMNQLMRIKEESQKTAKMTGSLSGLPKQKRRYLNYSNFSMLEPELDKPGKFRKSADRSQNEFNLGSTHKMRH